jgi:hypothetical protein
MGIFRLNRAKLNTPYVIVSNRYGGSLHLLWTDRALPRLCRLTLYKYVFIINKDKL